MNCGPCGGTTKVNGQSAGGGGAPAGPDLLFSLPDTVVVTDGVLNTIFSYSLPGGTLANDDDHLVIEMGGNALQSNVAAQTWSFGFSVNAVVIWFDTSIANALSAQRRTWTMQIDIQRKTATTLAATGWVSFATNPAAAINGLGDISIAPAGSNALGSTNADPAAAWAANQLIDFAVQASSAGLEFVTKTAKIYLQTIA